MATREELEQKINKLEVNMNRTDRIVNGGEDEDVLIDGGQLVPSIRKWQKELGEEYGFPQELVQQAEDAADRAEDATNRVLEVPTYTSGLELTSYNQLIRDSNGEFWRVSGQVDLPYVTTGAAIPEDDALVPAGDAVLRQDLSDSDKGAAMVARGVVAVDSIADLLALPEGQRKEGLRYLVKGYHAGSDVGGGEFYWSSDSDKTEHDGGYVIDPSHPSALFSPSWYTTTQSGDGVFVRISRNSEVFLEEYGARTGFTIDYEFANALTKAEADCSILKSLAGSTFTVTQALSAGQVNIDLMSDIVSEVAGTTLTVGYNSTAKLATSLSSDYVPFNGPAIVSLSSVEGLEVGDLISIVTNDVFHPSRYYVYKCGITSTAAYISGNNVYLNHEIPFPLSASGSRVIALQPSKSSIKNIRFVGASDPAETRRAFELIGGVGCVLENIETDGFGDAGIAVHHSVDTKVNMLRIQRSYFTGTNTSYGLVIYSSTDTVVDGLNTHTGRHGFATGANSYGLPSVGGGDDRGCPVFGLVVKNSTIFPELGVSPPAGGGDNGFDCHAGTYDVTVEDSSVYKFQITSRYVNFSRCKIHGAAGNHSLLGPIPDTGYGRIVFRECTFEGNGRIQFNSTGASEYSGGMHMPEILFENCTSPVNMAIRPLVSVGSEPFTIGELKIVNSGNIQIRDHDLDMVTIRRITLIGLKDGRRARYTGHTGTGSRVDVYTVNDCEELAGYRCIDVPHARRVIIENLNFVGNEGNFQARFADDAYISLKNVRLNWQAGTASLGVQFVDQGGGGSLYRIAAPMSLRTDSSYSQFANSDSIF